MSQGSRRNSTRINLDDDLIGQRLAKPAEVTLAGRDLTIRRDLTAEEIFEFWALVTENKGAEAFVILMSLPLDEAKALDAKLQKLPAPMYVRKIHQIIEIAGLKRGNEPEDSTGESTPSSSGS